MADNESPMKKFNFTIHKYKGEDGYQKLHVIARFQMECIDDDVACELAEAIRPILPFDGLQYKRRCHMFWMCLILVVLLLYNPDLLINLCWIAFFVWLATYLFN